MTLNDMLNFKSTTMKKLSFIVVLFLLFSCQKNEIELTGNLVVKFNNPQYLSTTPQPEIFIVGDDYYPLVEKIDVDNQGILRVDNLNYGNYYLEYVKQYSSGNNIGYRKLFQINAGKTTNLTINL